MGYKTNSLDIELEKSILVLNKLAALQSLQPGKQYVWEIESTIPLNKLSAIYSLAGSPITPSATKKIIELWRWGLKRLSSYELNFTFYVVIYGLIVSIISYYLTNLLKMNFVLSIFLSTVVGYIVVMFIVPLLLPLAILFMKRYK